MPLLQFKAEHYHKKVKVIKLGSRAHQSQMEARIQYVTVILIAQ